MYLYPYIIAVLYRTLTYNACRVYMSLSECLARPTNSVLFPALEARGSELQSSGCHLVTGSSASDPQLPHLHFLFCRVECHQLSPTVSSGDRQDLFSILLNTNDVVLLVASPGPSPSTES
jgi:hypothetical protein